MYRLGIDEEFRELLSNMMKSDDKIERVELYRKIEDKLFKQVEIEVIKENDAIHNFRY